MLPPVVLRFRLFRVVLAKARTHYHREKFGEDWLGGTRVCT
ncbi:hypothetical protein ACVILJ_007156 [Bradyrhizobium diazoefficiens]